MKIQFVLDCVFQQQAGNKNATINSQKNLPTASSESSPKRRLCFSFDNMIAEAHELSVTGAMITRHVRSAVQKHSFFKQKATHNPYFPCR